MEAELTTDIFVRGQWLINDEMHLVSDILRSFVRCNPNLALLDIGNVIARRDHMTCEKVKILSGGASGHEPAYAGYVGQGMLTAAVQGEIFLSPPPDLIFRTLKELSRRNIHGTLIIINSRLSDRLAFGLAMEKISALENVQVKLIIVNDEIRTVGEKNGLTGTILIQKIAGAMSELGFFLDEIYNFCTSILDDIITINVTLNVPQSLDIRIASTARNLQKKEMEFGAGFHGEPGFLRLPLSSAEKVVKIMLENVLNSEDNLFKVENSASIVVVINNLGCCTKLEERVFIYEVIKQLELYNVKIARMYSGAFFTSLNTSGFSLTVMRLTNDKVLEYIDHECFVSSWFKCLSCEMDPTLELLLNTKFAKEELRPKKKRGPDICDTDAVITETVIKFAAQALISCERQLNLMDTEVGDGDTGTNIKKAAAGLTEHMAKKNLTNPFAMLKEMSEILEHESYGLFGILFSIMFAAAARPFGFTAESKPVDVCLWCDALDSVVRAVECYGKVQVGDRTILDPLTAAAIALRQATEGCGCNEGDMYFGVSALKAAVNAAEAAAKNTKRQVHPDPGAHAIALIFRAIYEAMKYKLSYDFCDNVSFRTIVSKK